jgi:hypothetical protein
VVFAASAGDLDSASDFVGAWGARVLARAVLQAAYSATGTRDIPALSEL